MIATLRFARIIINGKLRIVIATEEHPLPESFNFIDPLTSAYGILAIMSKAVGGHTIHKCQLRVHPSLRTAYITGLGVHVFYCPKGHRYQDNPIDLLRCTQIYDLGSVATSGATQ